MSKKKGNRGPHCEMGRDRRAAVVLSVRGRVELREGRPAAGITGTILALLGEALALMGFFLLQKRGDFTITNAHTGVEYLALTGRTEVSRTEIEDPANLQRLAGEIGDITDVIFVCGDRAEWAVDALLSMGLLNAKVRIVRLRHLSLRSLNQIHEDLSGELIQRGNTQAERRRNTERRLKVVASDVLAQIR